MKAGKIFTIWLDGDVLGQAKSTLSIGCLATEEQDVRCLMVIFILDETRRSGLRPIGFSSVVTRIEQRSPNEFYSAYHRFKYEFKEKAQYKYNLDVSQFSLGDFALSEVQLRKASVLRPFARRFLRNPECVKKAALPASSRPAPDLVE